MSVVINSLAFSYANEPLLAKINFSVNHGEALHVRGVNGAGKTTLLKLIAGILQPKQGTIYYCGREINTDRLSYQQQLCYVGHKTGLHAALTVKENCLFDHHWHNFASFQQALVGFGLQKLAHEICAHLSQGQRRLVSLLRLAMTTAPIWLLDEPFVGLDQHAAKIIYHCFDRHLCQGGIIILTSHQQLSLKSLYEYWL